MTNPFSGIGKTKASMDANYVTPGHYVNRIDRVILKKNRTGSDIFIIEMTVLHALSVEETVMNGKTLSSNREGLPCSQLISFAGAGAEMALPNIKAFAQAVVEGFVEAQDQKDAEGNDLQELVLASIVSDDQPLAGMMVEVTARSIRTKKDTDYTKVSYVGEVDNAWRLKRGLITQEQMDLLTAEG